MRAFAYACVLTRAPVRGRGRVHGRGRFKLMFHRSFALGSPGELYGALGTSGLKDSYPKLIRSRWPQLRVPIRGVFHNEYKWFISEQRTWIRHELQTLFFGVCIDLSKYIHMEFINSGNNERKCKTLLCIISRRQEFTVWRYVKDTLQSGFPIWTHQLFDGLRAPVDSVFTFEADNGIYFLTGEWPSKL